jgi:hypothetical protein
VVNVTVICLIYRSPQLADWVYESFCKFTPGATFLFVANDPTPEVLSHLGQWGYPFILNINERKSDDELFALGFGKPEYMARVYAGYNAGIMAAETEYVCLVNSDNYFSPGWLEGLCDHAGYGRIVTSTLVERSHPKHAVFPGAVHGEFGGTPEEFNEAGFLSLASDIRTDGITEGIVYMPALVSRDVAIRVGLYPCGNLAGASFDEVTRYGDEALFDRLAAIGVEHVTSLSSVVYHLKEGERDDADCGGDEL